MLGIGCHSLSVPPAFDCHYGHPTGWVAEGLANVTIGYPTKVSGGGREGAGPASIKRDLLQGTLQFELRKDKAMDLLKEVLATLLRRRVEEVEAISNRRTEEAWASLFSAFSKCFWILLRNRLTALGFERARLLDPYAPSAIEVSMLLAAIAILEASN